MKVWKLSDSDRDYLSREITWATCEGEEVRVAWDEGLMVKVGQGAWTYPLGEPEHRASLHYDGILSTGPDEQDNAPRSE